jgi:hypothetical protein
VAQAIAFKMKFTKELSCGFKDAEKKAAKNIARMIDSVGNKTKTAVKRATAKQAGVKYGSLGETITSRTILGHGGAIARGEYEIIARGVTLSLKEFTPRAEAGGISAAPWGRRRSFLHAFFGPGGHVFVRAHPSQGTRRGPRPVHSQLPIRKLWGPAIPKEMVKDEAEQVFYRTVEKLFAVAIEAQIAKAVMGPS